MLVPARKFNRQQGNLQRRQEFYLAMEGKVTEHLYFGIFNDGKKFPDGNAVIHMIRGNSDTSPLGVLKRMKNYLKRKSPDRSFEAWLVIDRDNWNKDQLDTLSEWTHESPNTRFLALSNPKFEYWLLLHFDEGNGIASPDDCSTKLAKCKCGYDKRSKSFDASKITRKNIEKAITRAKKRDKYPHEDWPHEIWNTRVYRLVEKILDSSKK
jgi:hypothetical protein